MNIRVFALPSTFYLFRPSLHCDHLTSIAAHLAFRETCSMLVYLFNNSLLFPMDFYSMYKRTTADTEGEVGAVNCFKPPAIHYCRFQGGSSGVGLCCLFWCQSFGDVSLYVCLYYFSSV